MHVDNQDQFFNWLVAELSPITDADPNALAKYVLALVKKPDKSPEELKEFTNEQLNVFLTDHTAPFVEKIFSALITKSYLTPTEPEATQPPAASSEAKRARKEDVVVEKPKTSDFAFDTAPEVPPGVHKNPSRGGDSSRPARKRISPPPTENKDREKEKEKEKTSRDKIERRRSRSPRDRRGNRQTSSRGGRSSPSERDRYSRRRSRSRSFSGSRSPPYKPRRNRRCRDFEQRGYCVRGEQCHYDHGPDPVVVDENALSTMVPIPTAPPNFSLPPPGYNPHNPPPPGVVVSAGEYNPETPALTVTNYNVPPPPIPGQWQQPPPQAVVPQYVPQPVTNFSQPPPNPAVTAGPPLQVHPGPFRGGLRGRGSTRGGRGGMGRGGFQSGPINRDNCTLQVAKIPPELNNISKLNEHFGAFGTVENIQVRYNGEMDSALVTYASKFDASKAYKSPAPVLNNRFIKVFWHKPEGAAEGGENAASGKPAPQHLPPKPMEKPKIATVKESKFVSAEIQNQRKQLQDAKERLEKEKKLLSSLVKAQNEHNRVLDKWMTKQKELLPKARNAGDDTEKKNAMKLVKHLHRKIKECKEEVDGILLKISEKSMVVEEVTAQIEQLRNPTRDGDSRKRLAGSDGEEPQVKMSSVVVVKGVKEEMVSDLMAHMEQFGEVFDTSIKVDDGIAVFPFRRTGDALKLMAEGKTLNGEVLDMELKTERIEEIPSTDTNMSANQLLAAIPSSLESDDDDDLLND